MNKRVLFLIIFIGLITVGLLGLFVYKNMDVKPDFNKANLIKWSKYGGIIGGIIFLGVVIVWLIHNSIQKSKGEIKFEEVPISTIKEELTQKLIDEYKIPSSYYCRDTKKLKLSNPRNLFFNDQRIFKVPTTGAKWVIFEVFIIGEYNSGFTIFEVPLTEGKDVVKNDNFSKLHNTIMEDYIENKLFRRKLPIHSYEEKKQKMMQMFVEHAQDSDEVMKLMKDELSVPVAQPMVSQSMPLEDSDSEIQNELDKHLAQADIKKKRRSKDAKRYNPTQSY